MIKAFVLMLSLFGASPEAIRVWFPAEAISVLSGHTAVPVQRTFPGCPDTQLVYEPERGNELCEQVRSMQSEMLRFAYRRPVSALDVVHRNVLSGQLHKCLKTCEKRSEAVSLYLQNPKESDVIELMTTGMRSGYKLACADKLLALGCGETFRQQVEGFVERNYYQMNGACDYGDDCIN